ncbi:MAG: hypothetical protein WAL30_07120 [Candidatus Aquirickettsiella sp.]
MAKSITDAQNENEAVKKATVKKVLESLKLSTERSETLLAYLDRQSKSNQTQTPPRVFSRDKTEELITALSDKYRIKSDQPPSIEPIQAVTAQSNTQSSDVKNTAQKLQTNKSSSGQNRPTPPKKPAQVSTGHSNTKNLGVKNPAQKLLIATKLPLRPQLSGVVNPKPVQTSISVEKNLATPPPPLPAKKSRQTATAHSGTKNLGVKSSVQNQQLNKSSSGQGRPPIPSKKPVQASTTRSNTKNPVVENPAQKLQANEVSSVQGPALPPRNPGQTATTHSNTKNPENSTDTINKDTYLSLQLNMDYLSADISALYTINSDSMNDLLNPIKKSIKQLESATFEQKIKALATLNSCLTNLPVNISNLGLRDKVFLEEITDANENKIEALKNKSSLLINRPIDFSKISLIQPSLKRLLSAQNSVIRENESNDIICWLNELPVLEHTKDLIKKILTKLQNPEEKISELLNELLSNLQKSSALTSKLIKASEDSLRVMQNSTAQKNEQVKIIQFETDHLVKANISEFIKAILEKNTPQIQINKGIFTSINLTIDSFKHILSKIALSLVNEKQKYRGANKDKNLDGLQTLITKMWQLDRSIDQEKNSDYANVLKEIIAYAVDLIKNEKPTEPLLNIANIEKILLTLDKNKNPKLYLKIKQYYFFLKCIVMHLDRIGDTNNFEGYLPSYFVPLPLTAIFLKKMNVITDLLTTDNSDLEKTNPKIFETFGLILSNMQDLLHEQPILTLKLKNDIATFLGQLINLFNQLSKEKYFLENTKGEICLKQINDIVHAIKFSIAHTEYVIEKEIRPNVERKTPIKNIYSRFSNQYRSLKNQALLTYSDIKAALPSEPLLNLLENEIQTLHGLDTLKEKEKEKEKTTYTQSLIRLNIILGMLHEKIQNNIEGKELLNSQILNLQQAVNKHKKLSLSSEKIIYDFEIIEKDPSLLQKAYQTLTTFYKISKTPAPFILNNISDLKKLDSTKSIKTLLINHYQLVSKTIINKQVDSKTFEKLKADKNKSSNFNATTVKTLLFSNLPNPIYELIALKLNYLLSHNEIIETQKKQKLDSFALGFNATFIQKIIELEPLFERVISKKNPHTAEKQFAADFLALATNIFAPLYSKPLTGCDHLKEMENHLNQLHKSMLYIISSIENLPPEHFYKQNNKKAKLSLEARNDLNSEIQTSIKNLLSLVNLSKIQISDLKPTPKNEKSNNIKNQASNLPPPLPPRNKKPVPTSTAHSNDKSSENKQKNTDSVSATEKPSTSSPFRKLSSLFPRKRVKRRDMESTKCEVEEPTIGVR